MLLRRADSRHSNAGLDGAVNFDHDIASLSASPAVAALLQQLCDLTGMGFAAVARVTEDRWVACHVLDKIEFGLEPGAELKIKTTICDEIRSSGEEVFIDWVSNSPFWSIHPTPILYGFQSYVSVPLYRKDGSFFGTFCAIDPAPRTVDTVELRAAVGALAAQLIDHIDELQL